MSENPHILPFHGLSPEKSGLLCLAHFSCLDSVSQPLLLVRFLFSSLDPSTKEHAHPDLGVGTGVCQDSSSNVEAARPER